MASYHITVNERMALGKSVITFLHSIPQAITIEKPAKPKSELYKSLDRAFADVRLMMDGKKKEKTLDELIEELQEERENELQNNRN